MLKKEKLQKLLTIITAIAFIQSSICLPLNDDTNLYNHDSRTSYNNYDNHPISKFIAKKNSYNYGDLYDENINLNTKDNNEQEYEAEDEQLSESNLNEKGKFEIFSEISSRAAETDDNSMPNIVSLNSDVQKENIISPVNNDPHKSVSDVKSRFSKNSNGFLLSLKDKILSFFGNKPELETHAVYKFDVSNDFGDKTAQKEFINKVINRDFTKIVERENDKDFAESFDRDPEFERIGQHIYVRQKKES